MNETNSKGAFAKLVLIGLGAMFLYNQFGPIGLIVMGVVLMLVAK